VRCAAGLASIGVGCVLLALPGPGIPLIVFGVLLIKSSTRARRLGPVS
jgi:hypothetical protein